MAAPETRHLSILLTDIKGFTDKTSHKTRADIQTMLDEHRAVVLPILEKGGGRLIKTIGDAFLMTFESPTNAVLAGVAVQEALTKLNEGRSADDRLEIRIAINSGEINLVEGDVFGEPVNITARIEGIAEAGQVYFTEAVYLAMNKAEVPSSEVGLMQLKGIPEKIRVYKVRREEPVGAVSAAAHERVGLRRFLPPMSSSAAAPSAFGPGVKAIPANAASLALPSPVRRAVALLIDAALCTLLLNFLFGGGHQKIRVVTKPSAAPIASVEDQSASFAAGNWSIRFDNGIHARIGDMKIEVDDSGIHVTHVQPHEAVAMTKAGGTTSILVDEDGDEHGPILFRIMHGAKYAALVWAIYNLLFLKWLSGSPGKALMKLRVVALNGQPLEKRQRMLRAVVSVVSIYVFFIGYLWALWEPQRRTWHDLLAGTRVVPE